MNMLLVSGVGFNSWQKAEKTGRHVQTEKKVPTFP
jgi:hypothetical protein